MITIYSNWRQLLALLALAALFLLLLAIPAHGATAASSDPYSPDRSIAMDIPWMSPPTVIPSTGSASSRVMDQGVSMQDTSPDLGANFTWKLRYPIELQRWPILVLRYRASSLAQGGVYEDRVLQLDLRSGPTGFQTLTAVRLGELTLDGALHEVRRDLRGVAAGSIIEAIRFTFQAAGGTGRLDVVQLQFEQLAGAALGEPLAQAKVPFIVKDAAGNPLPGAEVRVGILERSNWTTIGQTGRDGQVILATTLGPGLGGNSAPVEAAVLRSGYLTEYVAPIQPPVGDAGIQVTLKPASQAVAPPAAVNPTPAQPSTGYDTGDGWNTPTVTYPPPAYGNGYSYGNDYYDTGYYGSGYYGSGYYGYYGGYGSGWWIPWHCWPGTPWGSVGAVFVFSNGDGDHDGDDGHHGNNGNHHHDGHGSPGHWTAPGGRGHGGTGIPTNPAPFKPLRPGQGDQMAAARGTQVTSPRVSATPSPTMRSGNSARNVQGSAPGVTASPPASWSPPSGISRGSPSAGVIRSGPAQSIGRPGPASGWSSGGSRGGTMGGSAGGGGRGGGGGGHGR